MKLLLVHHADAVGPAIDPQRPLSPLGRGQAARMADAARSRGFAPAAVWHSGKLRARQTAEPFLELNPFATFKMMRGLLPDDPPEMMRETLRGLEGALVLVGHQPSLPALARLLAAVEAFPLHGIVELERIGSEDEWTERWRAEP